MKRILELDGLRFFAILSVLGVHYRPPDRPALDFLSLGWIGVDLFFVISGFLITANLVALRGTTNPYRVFYWRRTLRIVPPYYLVLVLVCGLELLRHLLVPRDETLFALLFLSSLAFWQPIWQSIHAALPLLLHGVLVHPKQLPLDNHVFTLYQESLGIFWSLSIEELFYLIWAPVVLKSSRKYLLVISLAAIFLCPLLRVLGHSPSYEENFFFLCRFDTLMMGSLLALLFIACSRGKIRRETLNRSLLVVAVFSLVCLAALCIHDGFLKHLELRSALSFAAFGYSLLALFFASIVGLAALHAGSQGLLVRLLRSRALVYCGTVSYMMYLIHIPVYVTLYKLFSRHAGYDIAPTLWLGLLAALGTVAFASFSWRFFEKPILRFKDASFAVPRKAQARDEEILRA